jgi:hypothetical protein
MLATQGIAQVSRQLIPPLQTRSYPTLPQITGVGVPQVRRIQDGVPGEYRRTDAERKGTVSIEEY